MSVEIAYVTEADVVLQNIASGATHFVAREGSRVVGWCDILPESAPAVRHCGSLEMGVLASSAKVVSVTACASTGSITILGTWA